MFEYAVPADTQENLSLPVMYYASSSLTENLLNELQELNEQVDVAYNK